MSQENEDPRRWFCLRSQPKHEHIAAAYLRQLEGVDVFCPRIKFQRATKNGPIWFTEALFPNYLFAKYDPEPYQVQIRYAQGISGIVHFGPNNAVIPESAMDELKREVGGDELRVIPANIEIGDEVKIAEGTFLGLSAVVKQVLPAKQRVQVLLDFLGRQTEVTLPVDKVVVQREGHILAKKK